MDELAELYIRISDEIRICFLNEKSLENISAQVLLKHFPVDSNIILSKK